MPSSTRGIVKRGDSKEVVFDYVAKEFPVAITSQANDFVSAQQYQRSDFKISDLVAQQSGINELQRKSLEDKIEAVALEKLKEVEEKAYKEAYELGLIEGTDKAFAESKLEFETRLKGMDDMLQEFEVLKQKLITENEGSIMALVFQIAKRVAMKEITQSPEVIRDVLVQLIDSIQTDEKVTVRVAPEDFDFLENLRQKTNRESDPLTRVKCEGTEGIQKGGCVVETNYGSIDATVEERVKRAWDILESRIPQVKGNQNGG